MAKHTRSLRDARRVVAQAIARARDTGDGRLPTVHDLAAQAGVSHRAILSVVGTYRVAGTVTVERKRGIHVNGMMTTGRETDRPHVAPVWRLVLDQLDKELIEGRHRDDGLPSVKELATRFSVNYRTVRKAIDHLVAGGRIERTGTRLHVPHAAPAAQYGTIVLVTAGDQDGNPARLTPRANDHFRYLEQECSRAQLLLHTVCFKQYSGVMYEPGLHAPLFTNPADPHTILGFIVWPMPLPTSRRPALMSRILALKRPVAVLEESRTSYALGSTDPHVPVRAFVLALSRNAGVEMGRYLLELGHRRAVYISPVHREGGWSYNRLEGIRQAFSQAGVVDGITAVADPRYVNITEIRDIDTGGTDTIDSIMTAALGHPPADAAVLRRAADDFRARMADVLIIESVRTFLTSLLKQALEDSDATVWIAANDIVALECVDFLRQAGRKVPEEISVVGFDDSPDAFSHRITSYNFNGAATMHAMVRFVLDPANAWWKRHGNEPVEMEGFVSARASSGPAPKQGG